MATTTRWQFSTGPKKATVYNMHVKHECGQMWFLDELASEDSCGMVKIVRYLHIPHNFEIPHNKGLA